MYTVSSLFALRSGFAVLCDSESLWPRFVPSFNDPPPPPSAPRTLNMKGNENKWRPNKIILQNYAQSPGETLTVSARNMPRTEVVVYVLEYLDVIFNQCPLLKGGCRGLSLRPSRVFFLEVYWQTLLVILRLARHEDIERRIHQEAFVYG